MVKILETVYAKFRRLDRSQSGQDMLEYAMLLSMIALVCISGVQSAANSVNNMFGQVSQAFDASQQQQQGTPPPAPGHHHGGGDHGGGGHGWGWH
jgi:Flp pilus assembly pilin Flp